jgi:hypothetical protein
MLLTQDKLVAQLKRHLSQAERVDLAMAWASFSEALTAVLAFAGCKPACLRSIVGIAGNTTHPQALHRLLARGELRIPDTTPLFHPKVILFHQADRVIVWVGSANLTRCGFGQNTEVMAEFEDDGTAVQWFNGLWDTLDDDPAAIIRKYEAVWKPAAPAPREAVSIEKAPSKKEFEALTGNLSDWPSFVAALRAANLYWLETLGVSVEGETTSWLNTITLGNEIVRRESWEILSKTDYQLLMGIAVKIGNVDAGYGLLGSMTGAGDAKNVFNEDSAENLRIRERVRRALQPVLAAASENFPDATIGFIRKINEIHGFGGAIATRFLALARPEMAVSVNRGSQDGLAALSNLPRTAMNKVPNGQHARSYADLLAFLRQQQWYFNPTPRGAYEQTLADNRAALLDCLVYRPVT